MRKLLLTTAAAAITGRAAPLSVLAHGDGGAGGAGGAGGGGRRGSGNITGSANGGARRQWRQWRQWRGWRSTRRWRKQHVTLTARELISRAAPRPKPPE